MIEKELLEQIEKAATEKATRLDFCGQLLSFIPKEIGKLTNLKYLDLENHQFSSLPTEIVELAN
ncbi:MAG: hypothetical protein AAF349_26435 [Cyanobacteria bacterium P01_A01_bin.68]